jgi:hypothetical protein
MRTNLDTKLDTTWKASRRAKPRSKRRDRLENDMVQLQLRRMRAEIRALRKREA